METTNEKLIAAISPFLEKKNTYCVGLSGGSDSVLLLRYLKKISEKNNFKIIALHLNHSLRGAESDCDAEFCEGLCADLGVELIVKKADIKKYALENKLSIEDAARKYRYRWFAETCGKMNAAAIFIAHHADDQAETVLLRLFRGAGLKGLGGMKKVSFFGELKIIRPWLDVPREILDRQIEEEKIGFRYDTSNSDVHFDRNWLRHFLIPEINKHFNSDVKKKLLRASAVSSETYDYISACARGEYLLHKKKSILGNLFPISYFKKLHSAIQGEILMMMIDISRKNHGQTSYDSLIKLREFVLGDRLRNPSQLPGKTAVGKAYDFFYIGAEKDLTIKETKIKIGERIRTGAGLTISALPADRRGESLSNNGEAWRKVAVGERAEMRQFARLPANAELTVRSRRDGDRYFPINGKEIKVKNLLINTRIPQKLKEAIPLVEHCGRIVWLSGWRVSEEFKIASDREETGMQNVVLEVSI